MINLASIHKPMVSEAEQQHKIFEIINNKQDVMVQPSGFKS